MHTQIEEALRLEARKYLATIDLFEYCKLMHPHFYKDDRQYLKDLCYNIQSFLESEDERFLVINLPPRHGKSYTATNTTSWLLGRNPKAKIMTASYNEILSTNFAKQVRDTIDTKKVSNKIIYNDIFPNTKIKKGDSSASLWSLKGNVEKNYLATSPSGTATGFGANCLTGNSKISTDKGLIKISDLYNDRYDHQILTLNHENNILEYERIVAFKKTEKQEVYEVTTSDGRKIKATKDHRFYIKDEGYKTVSWIMSNMQSTKSRARKNVLGVLRQNSRPISNICMQILPKFVHASKIRDKQVSKKWNGAEVLLQKMFTSIKRSIPKNSVLSLWKTSSKNEDEILFSILQRKVFNFKNIARHKMRLLWKNIYAKFTPKKVLFNEMQEQTSFKKFDRKKEPKLQRWFELSCKISQITLKNFIKRWDSLSTLWSGRTKEVIGTSYRSQKTQQCNEKFDYSMSEMSSDFTSIKSVRKCKIKRDVYDIQTESNHNFFANGFLSHNCIIVDDLIRSAEEAYNERVLDKHFEWFSNTMLQRLEGSNWKVIIIMTRWASNDLAGKILQSYKDVKKIIHKAIQDDGSMLCEEVLNKKDYDLRTQEMNVDIREANYQQEPIDIKGRLYGEFKEWESLPRGKIYNQTDTADTGNDYLCAINYVVYENEVYVIDVLYTQEPMEETEKSLADMLMDGEVNEATIESNNGGRGFARNVKRIMEQERRINRTIIKSVAQTKNKESRILTSSGWVTNHVYMPRGWKYRHPEFYKSITSYQRKGKNAFDDAEDCLASIFEKVTGRSQPKILSKGDYGIY